MNSWRTYGVAVAAIFCLGGPAVAQETHTVSGRVTNEQGQGIASVIVTAHRDGAWWDSSLKVATAGDGSFQLQLSSGDYAFTASPPRTTDYVMKVYPDGPSCIDDNWPLVTVNDRMTGLNFDLVRGGKISFTLLDEDGSGVDFDIVVLLLPLSGGWCYTWDPVNLDQGVYVSPSINPGNYQIRIDTPNHEEYPSQNFCGDFFGEGAETASVTIGSTTDLGQCQLIGTAADFEITGQVTEKGSIPIPEITVRAYSDVTREVVASTQTGEDGSYLLSLPEGLVGVQVEAVPGLGSWNVSEFWDDCSCQYRFAGFDNPDPTQTQEWCSESLEAGTDHSNVNFDLEPGGRLSFQLLDNNGNPIEFACPLRLTRIEGHIDPYGGTRDMGIICHDVMTEADGSFVSTVLVPGIYHIALFPPEGSGFVRQAYCGFDWQGGPGELVEPYEVNDLGACRLLTDDIEIRSASGYLFSFDEDWLLGRPQIVANSAAAADINGDTLIDVVVGGIAEELDCQSAPGSPAQSVFVFVNQGGNVFVDETASWVPFHYCGGPSPFMADFDCDGYTDLGIADYGVEWSDGTPWGAQDTIWKNVDGQVFEDTLGTWIPLDNPLPEVPAISFCTSAFTLVDLEGDGDIDILRPTPKEQILINDGSGHFTVDLERQSSRDSSVIDAIRSSAVTLRDLDADGVDDLVVVDQYYTSPEVGQPLRLFRGLADGTFSSFTLQSVVEPLHWDATAFRVVAWDFDGDGSVEVYVGYEVYPPNVNSSNFGIDPLDQLYEVEHVENQELVVTDQTHRVQQSDTFNGTFNAFLADFDNDGDMDIVIGNNSQVFGFLYQYPAVRILINDGEGGLSPLPLENFPAFNATPVGITLLDSDNDGDLDIFIGANPVRSLLFVNLLLEKHDLNGDGYVLPNDAAEVVAAWGPAAPGLREDLNQDGTVDSKDLSLILRYQTSVRASNDNLVPRCTKQGEEGGR